jgi:C1A family cysteine protease
MPDKGGRILSAHAILNVGYDDGQGRIVVMISLGPKWWMEGYFNIPYCYLVSDVLSADFWTNRLVEVF